ncbi:hypothetical protein FA15DRAFT_49787 [Coprinopsis marcescibilis]|uniref:Uncharacterized protein n=1 Tax=Coprinopsis marcescibilis TaxID=230819 RepID=A0A5C3KPU6_COPMA|nr:hypothetical protein FA15DRAFT_49787 [Coprinopsis marcescibilis]
MFLDGSCVPEIIAESSLTHSISTGPPRKLRQWTYAVHCSMLKRWETPKSPSLSGSSFSHRLLSVAIVFLLRVVIVRHARRIRAFVKGLPGAY